MDSIEFQEQRAKILQENKIEFKYNCDYPPLATCVIYYKCACNDDAIYCTCNGNEIIRLISAIPSFGEKHLTGDLEKHLSELKNAVLIN